MNEGLYGFPEGKKAAGGSASSAGTGTDGSSIVNNAGLLRRILGKGISLVGQATLKIVSPSIIVGVNTYSDPTSLAFVNAASSSQDGNGNVVVTLPTGGGSVAQTTFEFGVTFTGSDPTAITGLPSGWTSSISSNDVTITHNVGTKLRNIAYWGLSISGGVETLRGPSASVPCTIPTTTATTQFVFRINTSVANADSGGSARIVAFF
jgi:hypothetical protein